MKMDTIKFENKGEVKMIAHRGLSGLERENTCPAFIAAAQRTYYGIETDVHVTKDGKYIIVHDDWTGRVAGENLCVEESTFDQLRALRMKDIDNVTDRADIFLPSLEEYISICKKYEKIAVLELKNRMNQENVWEIAEIIKKMGWFEQTIFISFAGENLVDLKKKYPDAQAQFLTCEASDNTFNFMVENDLDADLCGTCLTKEFVDRLHSAGKKVNCWTLDKLEYVQQAKELGVDFITSNIVE